MCKPLSKFKSLMILGTTWDSFKNFSPFIFFFQAISSMACDLAPRLGTLKAATMLHAIMLWAIARAPLLFFDKTPIGRVLNLFSKDVDALDVTLPELISDGIYCFFEVTN